MATYLIDYENKKIYDGIKKLNESDTVIFFYTANSKNASMDMLKEVTDSKATTRCMLVDGGKNALDFQLVTYLGYLIKTNEKEKNKELYVIISGDTGFDAIIDFCKKQFKITVTRKLYIESEEMNAQREKIKNELKESIEWKNADADVEKIFEIIDKFITKDAINSNLIKYFKDSKFVGKFNPLIKPLLKDKK